jgi:transporter family-2 protein
VSVPGTPLTDRSLTDRSLTDRSRRAIGLGLAVICGAAGAGQSRINGELGARLHDGVAAAVISFASGLVLLLLLLPALPAGRRGLRNLGTALRTRRLRLWECLGGTCGALFVASQGLTVPSLGVALFTVALVAGQSTSSLAVDHAGLGPGGRLPLTPVRIGGAALAVAAVLVAVLPRLGSPAAAGLAVLPALAGAGQAWQQAVNGRVRVATGYALPTSLVNFTAGMIALLIAFGISGYVRGWPSGPLPREPWLYAGGVLGIAFIGIAANIVRFTGVLLLGLGTIAGQVIGAVVLDQVLPAAQGRPTATTYAGAALTLVAVLLAASPGRTAHA